ncbi:hypothetical protein IWX90DRAFT_440525 [Phyllosticta citrichinensis]|uniref:Uncharacterized protein n=1 Tax=Phyllosticta citrichinensis TaxID=1130410 RepID=A0ABR1XL09_9PEZI
MQLWTSNKLLRLLILTTLSYIHHSLLAPTLHYRHDTQRKQRTGSSEDGIVMSGNGCGSDNSCGKARCCTLACRVRQTGRTDGRTVGMGIPKSGPKR